MRETNYIFQSTQPKRAATAYNYLRSAGSYISIHAAQEGCDFISQYFIRTIKNFNPRSPRGLRLEYVTDSINTSKISIHAAQEGCDSQYSYEGEEEYYFNPRSPRGLRPL